MLLPCRQGESPSHQHKRCSVFAVCSVTLNVGVWTGSSHAKMHTKHTYKNHTQSPPDVYDFSLDAYMGVSLNGVTRKSSILIGFSIINHPYWGTTLLGTPHIYIYTPYIYIRIYIYYIIEPHVMFVTHQVKPGSLGTVTRCRTLVNPPGVTWPRLRE